MAERKDATSAMVTAQIRCPHCNKRANDVIYPKDARTFRVETVCQNRLCRRFYVTVLPKRAAERAQEEAC
jgi:hypothetical protein